MKLRGACILVFVFMLASCTGIYAGIFADQAYEQFMALDSYRARTTEKGVVPGEPGTVVVKEVVYKRPWQVRARVESPEKLAGNLFAYDGETVVLWMPRELFGIRIRGARVPPADLVKEVIEQDARWALDRFSFSFMGDRTIAGRAAVGWGGDPKKSEPYLFPYSSWLDKTYGIPLELVVRDQPGHSMYEFAFDKIMVNAPVDEKIFDFSFPENAVVFTFDLDDPGEPRESLQKRMNFPLVLPKKLPKGLAVNKIIAGKHCLPMALADMSSGGRWLTLTQMRAAPCKIEPEAGIEVKVGGKPAWLVFGGTFSFVSWNQGKTACTLLGNLPWPELIKVAESVH